MRKAFKLGFVIGRFQHLHNGHIKMIDAGLNSCEQLILLVGSSQESFTRRNPFNLKTRMDVIREHYYSQIQTGRLLLAHTDDMTHEGDGSHEWGAFLLNKVEMWKQHYSVNADLDCMVYGNDEERMSWFSPESIEHVSHIIIGRPDHEISATKMRKFLIEDNYEEWKKEMPRDKFNNIGTREWFERLQSELLDVKHFKELVK